MLYHDFMTSHAARVEHWDYKLEGWRVFQAARPNEVHQAVVRLDQANKLVSVVTQNVDGLHALAGTASEKLVELHGTNLQVECQLCGERSSPESHFKAFAASGKPPVCPCGGYLKTATISFGQQLREEDLQRAGHAAAETDLVLALGSTLSVQPAADFPLLAARRGVPYVIINRGATDHDGLPEVVLRLEGDVAEWLPHAVEQALAGPS